MVFHMHKTNDLWAWQDLDCFAEKGGREVDLDKKRMVFHNLRRYLYGV